MQVAGHTKLCPAVFDSYVLPLDITAFAEPLAERGDQWRIRKRRSAAQKADHWHRLPLRAQGACRGYRDAEQGNEAPTVHSILMQPQPR